MISELFANSFLSDELPIVIAHMKTIPPADGSDHVTFLYKYVLPKLIK